MQDIRRLHDLADRLSQGQTRCGYDERDVRDLRVDGPLPAVLEMDVRFAGPVVLAEAHAVVGRENDH